MVEVLVPLGIGIAVGYLCRGRDRVRQGADAAVTLLVVALLFLLGLAAGGSPTVRARAGDLGLVAVVLGLAATAGSLLLVAPLFERIVGGEGA